MTTQRKVILKQLENSPTTLFQMSVHFLFEPIVNIVELTDLFVPQVDIVVSNHGTAAMPRSFVLIMYLWLLFDIEIHAGRPEFLAAVHF